MNRLGEMEAKARQPPLGCQRWEPDLPDAPPPRDCRPAALAGPLLAAAAGFPVHWYASTGFTGERAGRQTHGILELVVGSVVGIDQASALPGYLDLHSQNLSAFPPFRALENGLPVGGRTVKLRDLTHSWEWSLQQRTGSRRPPGRVGLWREPATRGEKIE